MFEPVEILLSGSPCSFSKWQPLRVSVPFGQGKCPELPDMGIDYAGELFPCQSRVLHRWPDGSVKWCSIDWMHPGSHEPISQVRLVHCNTSILSVPAASEQAWKVVPTGWKIASPSASTDVSMLLRCKLSSGEIAEATPGNLNKIFEGQLCQRWQAELTFHSSGVPMKGLVGRFQVDQFRTQPFAICRLQLTNVLPAGHPNGNWDLGNGGSIYFSDFSVEFSFDDRFTSVRMRTEPSHEVVSSNESCSIFQASSGGDHWNSTNHLDRQRNVPVAFRGYRFEVDGCVREGLRATPQVSVDVAGSTFAIGVRRFWENFPKAISTAKNVVRLGLFPGESKSDFELQGGEQKTQEFAIYLGNQHFENPLDWYLEPLSTALSPARYAEAAAIAYLTPRTTDPNTHHHQLVDLAVDGDDTFLVKREKIDEYGWRHYGDLYGDHEAVFHRGSAPLISHYNNQYDCVGAFATQFLRSSDLRWFVQMIEMADHAWDIDTYHTDQDKSLYNRGLFWHTYHYADADTGTHRSYPRSINHASAFESGKDLKELGQTGKVLAKNYGLGGGPAAAHNYSTGWMWAYFLTGQEEYRRAAINAADYVIHIEDGRRTIFRWLSRSDTGLSIESSSGYWGPGRASGNSLHALLTGYELTNDPQYLAAAETLIRRVAHPSDNVASMDLLNAELRWFYTMHLQALTRYIDLKRDRQQFDEHYALAVATLNHYAHWMANHERPTLEHPEQLQYPTETWAAQDMRKWHILQYAAWMNRQDAKLSALFQRKADYFFDYVCVTLGAMPTRSLCRPVILMMQFGWQRHWFQQSMTQPVIEPLMDPKTKLPSKPRFMPQRTIAIQRAKAIIATGVVIAGIVSLLGLAFLVRWLSEKA
jgi:hypothetical protein